MDGVRNSGLPAGSNVSFKLFAKKLGVEDDTVTGRFGHFVRVVSSGRCFPESILHHFGVERGNDRSFEITLDNIFVCIAKLEAVGFCVTDVPAANVVHHINSATASFHDTEVTELDLEQKLGDVWSKLRSFQKVCVRFGCIMQKIYIADEMGTGKTLQSLAICKYFSNKWPVLVVCPSLIKNTWCMEITNWLGIQDERILRIRSGKDFQRLLTTEYDFCVVSYGLICKMVPVRKKFRCVVIDECHYIKTASSQRTKACLAHLAGSEVRMMLSGTPFSYPCEMFTQIKGLYPDLYRRFFKPDCPKNNDCFANRYCQPKKLWDRKWVYQFKGYDNQTELNAVLSTFMIRRKKRDVIKFLPQKIRIYHYLHELTKKQYREIELALKKEETELTATQQQRKYLESFRLTCRYKIKGVITFLKQLLVENTEFKNRKCLIFAHHTEMRKALRDFLEYEKLSFFVIDGSTSDSNRAQFEFEFQTQNKYQIAVLSITAACAGITLTKASCVIFTEIMFGPDMMLQAEDRAHRMGQTLPVDIIYLLQPKTTDVINMNLIQKKNRESTQIMEGEPDEMVCSVSKKRRNPVLNRVVTKRMMLQRSKDD